MGNEDKRDEIDEKEDEQNQGANSGSGQNDDSGSNNSSGGQAGGTSGNGGSNEKTFTQAQVNKMMSNEKHQGKNAALRALGIDPSNKALMESVKSFVASQKSDEDKNNEVLQQLATANALVEVMKAGVKPQYADDAVALAMAKASRNDSSIEEAMSEYKQKYPEWFASDADDSDDSSSKKDEEKEDESDDGKKKQFNGTGSTPPSGGKKQTDNKQAGLGKRLAASRKKSTARKSSYWN